MKGKKKKSKLEYIVREKILFIVGEDESEPKVRICVGFRIEIWKTFAK